MSHQIKAHREHFEYRIFERIQESIGAYFYLLHIIFCIDSTPPLTPDPIKLTFTHSLRSRRYILVE